MVRYRHYYYEMQGEARARGVTLSGLKLPEGRQMNKLESSMFGDIIFATVQKSGESGRII